MIRDRYSNFNNSFSFADTSDNRVGAWLGANFRTGDAQLPEPGSLALAGLALFGLRAARRRAR